MRHPLRFGASVLIDCRMGKPEFLRHAWGYDKGPTLKPLGRFMSVTVSFTA